MRNGAGRVGVGREEAGELGLDPDEIEEARWFSRDELVAGGKLAALPPAVSIARYVIDRWLTGEFDDR